MSFRENVIGFCRSHGLRLDKDLGQHFLVDEESLERIVETASIRPGERIVEIGPGIGILTRELLKKGASVTAIELDERLIPLLHAFVGETSGHLTVIHENALHVPMPGEPYSIVANIPYHITSPLLRHVFLESARHPATMTLLIQREVAEKICDAGNGGLLTIIVGLFGAPRIIAHVPPGSFFPPPKVDSSILFIECFDAPLADKKTIEGILKLLKIAFSRKRKMLRNTLGTFSEIRERLKALGIEETRRPQTLSVQEWIALVQP